MQWHAHSSVFVCVFVSELLQCGLQLIQMFKLITVELGEQQQTNGQLVGSVICCIGVKSAVNLYRQR